MALNFSALTPLATLLGALLGGSASLAAAIYTQRVQQRLQRVAAEVTRRETVYAEFVMSASHLLLNAHLHDDIELNGDEQRLVGLVNRMRLFAPETVLTSAEAVLKAILDTYLKPRIELRELVMRALAEGRAPDPLMPFSLVCRRDLDDVRRSMA